MIRLYLLKILLLLIVSVALHVQANPVGKIALSVGVAKRTDASGKIELLRTGYTVSEGDRIVTGPDAITMIIFMDDARLSLRSDSELIIKHYKFDPSGLDSRLVFELVRGGMRQISGKAAQKQPDSFRLNTPIAYIGVRGTDFLVKSSADSVETFIQEGKIFIHSNDVSCGFATSQCASKYLFLTDTDSARYLKMFPDGRFQREKISSEDVERVFGISLAKARVSSNDLSATDLKPIAAIKAVDESSSVEVVKSAATLLPANPNSQLAATITSASSATTEVVPPVTLDNPLPPISAVLLHNQPDLTRQLVWGKLRWSEDVPFSLLLPYDETTYNRKGTVGELFGYSLFRTPTSDGFASKLNGEVDFQIHSAEAVFKTDSQTFVASVSNPQLRINFDRSTFDTSLTLSQAQAGSTTLQASGKINDEGVFFSRKPTYYVAGAVNATGSEAGLLFSKDHADGVFKGITLWNAR